MSASPSALLSRSCSMADSCVHAGASRTSAPGSGYPYPPATSGCGRNRPTSSSMSVVLANRNGGCSSCADEQKAFSFHLWQDDEHLNTLLLWKQAEPRAWKMTSCWRPWLLSTR